MVERPEDSSRLKRLRSVRISAGTLVSHIAVLFKSLVDDPVQFHGQFRIKADCGRWSLMQNGVKDNRCSSCRKMLVCLLSFHREQRRKRKQIRAWIEFFTSGLLQVTCKQPYPQPFPGWLKMASEEWSGNRETALDFRNAMHFGYQLGQSEIQNLCLVAFGDENIRRFDIAVYDTF